MKLDAPQPRPPYTTTTTVPIETAENTPIPPDSFQEIDARIVRECFSVYSKRYGLEMTRILLKALAEKYTS